MAVSSARNSMRNSHVLFVPLITALMVCLTPTVQAKSQWTVLERIERFTNQTHHWGQKGQASANNGWSDYGELKIRLSDEKYILLQQWHTELLLEVYSNKSTTASFKALSIPGAGMFFSPRGANNCASDSAVQVGMFAEMTLFYIAQMFPQGPSKLLEESAFKARGAQAEFRFMKLAVEINKPWKVSGTVRMSEPGKHRLEITSPDKHSAVVDWSSQQKQLVDASERLENWDSCWIGSHQVQKDGSRAFKTDIADSQNITTFSQIREQLD